MSAQPPGNVLAKLVSVLATASGDPHGALTAAERVRTHPQIGEALRLMRSPQTKAVVGPANTAISAWAGALSATGISTEIVNLLNAPPSIYGAVVRTGATTRVPFNVPVARLLDDSDSGGRIEEGQPVPFARLTFDTLRLLPAKYARSVAVTKEMTRPTAGPDAEAFLRAYLPRSLRAAIDRGLLSMLTTATGATEITSTGATAAAITTDLLAMIAAVPDAIAPVWIAPPTTVTHIRMLVPTANPAPLFFGLPLIASANAGNAILLVDAAAVAYADNDDFELSPTDQAAVQLDDHPTNAGLSGSPAAPVATSLASLWQLDSVAFMTTRWLAFTLLKDAGAVAFMTVSY